MLPVARFLSFVHQNQLFDSSDKVLLAVSGGRDSVLMAHLFNEAGYNFGIAHCNFRLRDKEADEDEAFVRALADRFEVPFFCIRFSTSAFAGENKISIQMAARELRYKWFEETRTEHGFQFVAVAHHQSDATETILLNMVRGTGISGLHGIKAKRDTIVRPLLFLNSTEIAQLVVSEAIAYRDDSSNFSSKYARNKIRLKVIPHLKELNVHLDETFAVNSRRFAELEQFLNLQVSALRLSLFNETDDGNITIPLEKLKGLRPLKLLLFEIFKPYGFSEHVLDDLTKAWNGQAGKVFESPSHILLLDRRALILKKIASGSSSEIVIEETEQTVRWKELYFKSRFIQAADISVSKNREIAFFDSDLLQFPLKLRLWKKGDFFYPFGMKGKKKVSDFFTGLKLSLFSKENTPVLENGNGDILWVACYRTDDRYKITTRTKKVFILEHLNDHEQ